MTGRRASVELPPGPSTHGRGGSVRVLTAVALTTGTALALPASAAPAGDAPCVLSAYAVSEVAKALLSGPVHESALMRVRLLRPHEGHGRGTASCRRLRNVVTITDTRPGQSDYTSGQGWNRARAGMNLRYYEPVTSDPSAALWDTTGVVTISFRAYEAGAATATWCQFDAWSVSSAGAQRLLPAQMDCAALPG